VTNEEDPSGTTSEHFRTGIEDVVMLPMVAIALVVKKVLRSAWTILKHILDFLFPILLQLLRFPLFTLRILGDGSAALLKGIARILPIGGVRRAAWREFVSQHWAWLRKKISYKAFEEAVHHVFENAMAWVFRKCRKLTPSAALLVILGAVLWLPISFGLATLLHAVLIAKATSLPAWMQLLHPVGTIIAKSKLLVLPVYPAAWPQAKQHPSVRAMIGFWRYFTTLYFVRKTRYRYRKLEGAVAEAVEASAIMASSFGLRHLFDLLLAALNAAAGAIGRRLRNIAAISIALLASIPLFGAIVRRYADHYDEASQRPAERLSDRVSGFFSRWSIKFSAEYYEAKEREEAGSPARAGVRSTVPHLNGVLRRD
jgi:hypothetical protein